MGVCRVCVWGAGEMTKRKKKKEEKDLKMAKAGP